MNKWLTYQNQRVLPFQREVYLKNYLTNTLNISTK